jgi:hypothetical protein
VSDEPQPNDDEKPRRGIWANLPRGSVGRVLLLLMLLATVVYLQRRSGEIAGCANRVFNLPPPPSVGSPSVTPASSAGTIRARVALPETSTQ